MPSSVGMRRTTRVFGVVKGADGAQVLRSGRMLQPYSREVKLRKGSARDDWLRSIVAGDGNNGCKIGYDMRDDKGLVNGSDYGVLKRNVDARDTDLCAEKSSLDKVDEHDGKHQDYGREHGANKMFGIVYGRKRKGIHGVILDGKKYGNCYHRRNKRQKKDVTAGTILRHGRIAIIKHGSSHEGNVFGHFLYSVLRYMKTVGIQLPVLARFVMSEPLCGVYFSGGMELSQDSSSILGAGFCILSGYREHCPSFWVDFSAVPSTFMFMHCELLLRHLYMPLAFEHNSAPHQIDCSSFVENDHEEERSYPAQKTDGAPSVDNPASQFMLLLPASGSKMETCPSQHRYGKSHGIRKRRSSLRSKQGRNHSFSGLKQLNGMLASELIGTANNGHPSSSTLSGKKTWRSSRTSLAGYVDELNSAPSLSQEVRFVSCTANLLTTQFDQCVREEGVSIALEPSNSGECSLVVKKGGAARFIYKALEVTKPWFPNSATQCMVWAGDKGWKLEFPNKENWLKFKDLSKECIERNKQLASPRPSSTKIIPVPQVCEVLGYEKDPCLTFVRPDSYIVSDGDELSRAMTSKGSSYDMDSEDEEWLNVYNSKILPESWVSDESFENLIDVFEKDFYCNPRDPSNEKPVTDFCMEIVSKDALVAVYSYWTKKRKNRRSALVRVFQGHQPRKAFVPRSVFRKRRSFKRQPSQHGRGKQPGFLQAVKTERDALEEQATMHKVEEAQVFANRLAELAINKRHRAQSLTENADLAAYRAAMALRLAEAAQVMNPPELLHHINLPSESYLF
ncbi:hypothetical protein MLD38_008597 [Melastoma candidum]|uniref:Uncharacterized protein n=1 Tax=Melastoma candidum TaxID=119954 RepID=A0ACB9RWQ7_9MYRT|nr:hypothetical protein MLD38_008597 [Melastoma candidum]